MKSIRHSNLLQRYAPSLILSIDIYLSYSPEVSSGTNFSISAFLSYFFFVNSFFIQDNQYSILSIIDFFPWIAYISNSAIVITVLSHSKRYDFTPISTFRILCSTVLKQHEYRSLLFLQVATNKCMQAYFLPSLIVRTNHHALFSLQPPMHQSFYILSFSFLKAGCIVQEDAYFYPLLYDFLLFLRVTDRIEWKFSTLKSLWSTLNIIILTQVLILEFYVLYFGNVWS